MGSLERGGVFRGAGGVVNELGFGFVLETFDKLWIRHSHQQDQCE